jgi:hypothetical protein
MIIDDLWDSIGIARAPSAIISLHEHSVEHITKTIIPNLDWGLGTVWVGDNKMGWHGGAKLLRWVQNMQQGQEAYSFLSTKCDLIRIMPFMDGIPCSIHGWVFPKETIALRPCEMVIYRENNSTQLIYSGAATNWKPTETTQQQMQDVAVKVGNYLKENVNYRGSFTVDGVISKHGFRPTELNPRFGGAMNRMAHSIPELPLYLLHLCTAEGISLEYEPQKLRDIIVNTTDENPLSKGMYILEGVYDLEPNKLHIIPKGQNDWEVIEDADGTIQEKTCCLLLGPAAAGSLIFATIDSSFIAKGVSSAPLLASMFAFAAQQWDLDIPKLIPSPDLERLRK